MKKFLIFAFAFLAGIYSAAAQDLIVMRDGNIFEAKVLEVSPTEIKYKRYDHLDGPTIIVPVADVLAIRYENGKLESINNAPIAQTQLYRRERRPRTNAIDSDKTIFGINVNPGGAAVMAAPSGVGPSVSIELGKGNFNSEIDLLYALDGFGFLFKFNHFWHKPTGGAYFGGGIGYSFFDYWYYLPYDSSSSSFGSSHPYDRRVWKTGHSFTVGLNAGYKFVTRSGIYFRTGTFVGMDFGTFWNEGFTMPVYIKPDLAFGWTMR